MFQYLEVQGELLGQMITLETKYLNPERVLTLAWATLMLVLSAKISTTAIAHGTWPGPSEFRFS